LKRNATLPKDLFTAGMAVTKTCTIGDKDLLQQEQELRETLCCWSVSRWGNSAARALLEQDLSLEELKGCLRTILDEQDNLSPVIEDRLTTTLTNTVLRRRDIILATGQGRQLQDTLLSTSDPLPWWGLISGISPLSW